MRVLRAWQGALSMRYNSAGRGGREPPQALVKKKKEARHWSRRRRDRLPYTADRVRPGTSRNESVMLLGRPSSASNRWVSSTPWTWGKGRNVHGSCRPDAADAADGMPAVSGMANEGCRKRLWVTEPHHTPTPTPTHIHTRLGRSRMNQSRVSSIEAAKAKPTPRTDYKERRVHNLGLCVVRERVIPDVTAGHRAAHRGHRRGVRAMEVRHSVQAAEAVGICCRDPGAIAGRQRAAVQEELDEPGVGHPAVRGRGQPELGGGGDRPREVPARSESSEPRSANSASAWGTGYGGTQQEHNRAATSAKV